MTEEFDDQLRSELQDSFRLGADAATALDALGPAMARQRRNHNVRTGMLSSAVVLLASFGGLSLISGDPSDGEVPIAAVAPDDAPADAEESTTTTVIPLAIPAQPSPGESSTLPDATDAVAVTESSAVAASGQSSAPHIVGDKVGAGDGDAPESAPSTSGADAGDDDDDYPGYVGGSGADDEDPDDKGSGSVGSNDDPGHEDDDETPTTVGGEPQPGSSTPTTTEEPGSPVPTTTEEPDGDGESPTTSDDAEPPIVVESEHTVESECGTILVGINSDDEITLLDSTPIAGYMVDEEDTGPRRVVVRFDNNDSGDRCEIRAEADDGELSTSSRLW